MNVPQRGKIVRDRVSLRMETEVRAWIESEVRRIEDQPIEVLLIVVRVGRLSTEIAARIILRRDEMTAGVKDHAEWIATTAPWIAALADLPSMDRVDREALLRVETVAAWMGRVAWIATIELPIVNQSGDHSTDSAGRNEEMMIADLVERTGRTAINTLPVPVRVVSHSTCIEVRVARTAVATCEDSMDHALEIAAATLPIMDRGVRRLMHIDDRTILIVDTVVPPSPVPRSVDRVEWARDMVRRPTPQYGRRLLVVLRLVPNTVVPA